MVRTLLSAAAVFAVLLVSIVPAQADDGAVDDAAVRAAIARSLPLLQMGAKTFRERSEGRCISCHHQGLILQTVALARAKGFAVDESLAREEVDRVRGFYVRRQARYEAALANPAAREQADPYGNFNVHAGFWLWALAAERTPPDEALATTVRLLASKQWDDGRWSFTDTARAPMQAGDITTTALAAYALRNFGGKQDAGQLRGRIDAAQAWLQATSPRTTDDKAFRLLGLHWTAAAAEFRRPAAAQLLADQQADGSWSQQENMPPDAYATGLALVALQQAGELATAGTAYDRGVQWLMQNQRPDGSWFVRTRAIPTNPYFESGFPHGKSQFISYAATCWGTMALILAIPSPIEPQP